MFLRKYFLGLSNLSECRFTFLLNVYGVVYTSALTLGGGGGDTPKSVIADHKVLSLHLYNAKINLTYF